MSAPISFSIDGAPPRCDAEGCGAFAVAGTDGTEIDHLGRKALPHLNTCAHHSNWPHSEDAKAFAEGKGHALDGREIDVSGHPDSYKKRLAAKRGA